MARRRESIISSQILSYKIKRRPNASRKVMAVKPINLNKSVT